ncbi:hypothetical protein BRADI_2g27045v3 [Brachypodium distachyon]|uniref:Uncharacterized protein n=1 Tax=Brachypodium distachyon TaxID=15368 RepID=A0A2K2DAV1_BRADI|nr:hypothetical protein BRADI_2g27045v3 [Brachypodium distachyon]
MAKSAMPSRINVLCLLLCCGGVLLDSVTGPESFTRADSMGPILRILSLCTRKSVHMDFMSFFSSVS